MNPREPAAAGDPAHDDGPPFASWAVLYGIVIAWLVVTIALLGWLTRAFS